MRHPEPDRPQDAHPPAQPRDHATRGTEFDDPRGTDYAGCPEPPQPADKPAPPRTTTPRH